jgi:hypothetical protein
MILEVLKNIKNSKLFKHILSILLLIIIIDKLFILILLTIYYVIQRYIFNKTPINPVEYIKKYINPNKGIKYYLENEYDIKFSLLKENFTNFEPSNNLPFHLGSIFKHSATNFKDYPNVEIKPDKPLFSNNKFLPECCLYNSEYSSDRGCPCVTPEQQYYLQRRGVNKHKNDFIHDKNDYKNVFFSPTLAIKGEKFPFNPMVNKEYNIHFQKEPPQQIQSKIDEFNQLTNNLSFQTQGKI